MNRSLNHSMEIHFNFLLRASHKYANRDSPIVFRIVFRGQRKDVFTGMGCPVEHWMKNERVVSLENPETLTTLIQKELTRNSINYQRPSWSIETGKGWSH